MVPWLLLGLSLIGIVLVFFLGTHSPEPIARKLRSSEVSSHVAGLGHISLDVHSSEPTTTTEGHTTHDTAIAALPVAPDSTLMAVEVRADEKKAATELSVVVAVSERDDDGESGDGDGDGDGHGHHPHHPHVPHAHNPGGCTCPASYPTCYGARRLLTETPSNDHHLQLALGAPSPVEVDVVPQMTSQVQVLAEPSDDDGGDGDGDGDGDGHGHHPHHPHHPHTPSRTCRNSANSYQTGSGCGQSGALFTDRPHYIGGGVGEPGTRCSVSYHSRAWARLDPWTSGLCLAPCAVHSC